MFTRIDLTRDPSELLLALADEPGAVFLDCARSGPGAYSILSHRPSRVLMEELPSAKLGQAESGDPASPPFESGWIGYLAYEAAPRLNSDLRTKTLPAELPSVWWGRYDAALAYRHADRAWFLTFSPTSEGEKAAARLLDLARRWCEIAPRTSASFRCGTPESTLSPREHATRVREILEWIGRGHIYQANLTHRVRAGFAGSRTALYHQLRASNPAPYGAYLAPLPGLTIQSSSPELFLRLHGRRLETRPIKGTRPRDLVHPARDRELGRELLASEKDRAELTMIVDLERNDLGRVCDLGSIQVSPFPRLESYAAVHHLVASVEGTLADGLTFSDLLRATFPGGSITGAPKIRAMEILADLETTPRFVYTGALGYLDDRGDLELALTIRTLWISGQRLSLGIGGGIVADSEPQSEWEEAQHKGRALFEAMAGPLVSARKSGSDPPS